MRRRIRVLSAAFIATTAAAVCPVPAVAQQLGEDPRRLEPAENVPRKPTLAVTAKNRSDPKAHRRIRCRTWAQSTRKISMDRLRGASCSGLALSR